MLWLDRLKRWCVEYRFQLCAGLIISAAFTGGLVISKVMTPTRVAAAPPPPKVEPFLLQKVDPETAKQTNDAVPVTKAAVPPAPAYLFRGSTADLERATDCLAATIFYEAGAETVPGQMAVAQVVLNRARHPAYPKSICGVVFQGHERATGCQFSYTCDGSMARRPSPEAWVRHRGLAKAMLTGLVYPPAGLATHYHADWVLPAWSASLEKIRVEGTHLFFRYKGFWGTPAAYRGRPGGGEPAFGKLAALSVAHGGVAPDSEAVAALLAEAQGGEPPANLEHVSTMLESENKDKNIFLIHVDPLLEADALTTMAENACNSRKDCKIFGWADPGLLPRGLPLEPQDRAAMAFSYIRQTGRAEVIRWNCGLFPREKKQECL